VNVDNPPIRCP